MISFSVQSLTESAKLAVLEIPRQELVDKQPKLSAMVAAFRLFRCYDQLGGINEIRVPNIAAFDRISI